jgi:hypothetical protein
LCGSQQSHLSQKKFGLAEVGTSVSQMKKRAHHPLLHKPTLSLKYSFLLIVHYYPNVD